MEHFEGVLRVLRHVDELGSSKQRKSKRSTPFATAPTFSLEIAGLAKCENKPPPAPPLPPPLHIAGLKESRSRCLDLDDEEPLLVLIYESCRSARNHGRLCWKRLQLPPRYS